jgi:ribosomal protein L10
LRFEPGSLGSQVKQTEGLRRALPAGAKLIVAKNTLLGVASKQVPGWEDLMDDALQVCSLGTLLTDT